MNLKHVESGTVHADWHTLGPPLQRLYTWRSHEFAAPLVCYTHGDPSNFERTEDPVTCKNCLRVLRQMPDASSPRDKDLAVLADTYLNVKDCLGDRPVAGGFVCPHCDSDDPSAVCHSEKKYRWSPHDEEDGVEYPGYHCVNAEERRKHKVRVDAGVVLAGECPTCCSGVTFNITRHDLVLPGAVSFTTKCADCGQTVTLEVGA